MNGSDNLVVVLRGLQHEGAELPPKDRRDRLRAFLEQHLQRLPRGERSSCLNRLVEAFPDGLSSDQPSGERPRPGGASPEPKQPSLEDASLDDLLAEVQGRLENSRPEEAKAAKDKIRKLLGLDKALPSGPLDPSLFYRAIQAHAKGRRDPLLDSSENPGASVAEDVAHSICEELEKLGAQSLSPEEVGQLLAALWVEFGCLEFLARGVLMFLLPDVFREVRSPFRIRELPSVERLWSDPADPRRLSDSYTRNASGLIGQIGDYTGDSLGLAKTLLIWQKDMVEQIISLLGQLNPAEIEQEPGVQTGKFGGGRQINHEKFGQAYRERFALVVHDLVGPVDLAQFTDGVDAFSRLVRESLSQKILADLNNYRWPLRD